MAPTITLAAPEDLEEILALQHLAFHGEGQLYNDFSIPPLTQTLEGIRADFPNKVFLKANMAGTLVGSVRGFQKGETCFVERLIVHPDHRQRGVGTALMCALEGRFASARRFELFTGYKSQNNIRLYRKLGYSEVKREGIVVLMEKIR
ncbi:MAG: GNAT family N-acetyltransferase [Bryobacteraceae bacterium]